MVGRRLRACGCYERTADWLTRRRQAYPLTPLVVCGGGRDLSAGLRNKCRRSSCAAQKTEQSAYRIEQLYELNNGYKKKKIAVVININVHSDPNGLLILIFWRVSVKIGGRYCSSARETVDLPQRNRTELRGYLNGILRFLRWAEEPFTTHRHPLASQITGVLGWSGTPRRGVTDRGPGVRSSSAATRPWTYRSAPPPGAASSCPSRWRRRWRGSTGDCPRNSGFRGSDCCCCTETRESVRDQTPLRLIRSRFWIGSFGRFLWFWVI